MRCPTVSLAAVTLSAACLLSAPAARAQAVTRPTVTASAGVMRAVFETRSFSPDGGDVTEDVRTFYAVWLGGEVPVYARGPLTASVGAAGRAASDAFSREIGPQSVALYARLGTAQASGRLGVALDVGGGLFESGNTSGINSDGQTAIVAQVSGGVPAGRARLFAQVDAAFALPTDEEILVNTPEDLEGRPYPVRVRTGHQGGLQVGASVPAGPVEVALAVFAVARTEGSFRVTGDVPPPVQTGSGTFVTPRESPLQLGYSQAVGLVPSVTYRAPGGRLALRVDGSFSGYFSLEDVPLGFTVSSEDGPDVRPAVTVSASVGL